MNVLFWEMARIITCCLRCSQERNFWERCIIFGLLSHVGFSSLNLVCHTPCIVRVYKCDSNFSSKQKKNESDNCLWINVDIFVTDMREWIFFKKLYIYIINWIFEWVPETPVSRSLLIDNISEGFCWLDGTGSLQLRLYCHRG